MFHQPTKEVLKKNKKTSHAWFARTAKNLADATTRAIAHEGEIKEKYFAHLL
jgi:hypothetical protein